MALTTRQGAGTLLTQAQGDANWDILNGINESITGTTHTIDHTDENKTIEYNNASGVAVTLTAIATIDGANDSQISDFKVTLKNIGAGTVTVTCGGSNTLDDGTTSFTIPQYNAVVLQTDSTGAKWNFIGTSTNGLEGKSFASTDDVIDNFPSGTAMLFYQATAPTGWTGDDTNASHALQVVTETSTNGGSTGGSVDFSTVFALTATDDHTLLISEMPAHTHPPLDGENFVTSYGGSHDADGGPGYSIANATTGSTGGDGAHSHGIDLQVKYLNIIVATKD